MLYCCMQYDIYDTVKPAIFYRGARVNLVSESILSPPLTPATSFPINDRMLLFLTSELGEDMSGVYHDGILEVEWDEKTSSTLAVTVKLAFTDEHQMTLVQEWSAHMHMLSKSVEGIPCVLGVFHEDEEDGPSCLVLYHAGISLADRKQALLPSQRASFLTCLHSIHEAGVLHGNLSLENLLVRNSGDVTIANFNHARMDASEDQVREEYHSLCVLLDNLP